MIFIEEQWSEAIGWSVVSLTVATEGDGSVDAIISSVPPSPLHKCEVTRL